MINRAQMRQSCRELVHENDRLQAELCCKNRLICELEEANANLLVERDATDLLLGEAMDAGLKAK